MEKIAEPIKEARRRTSEAARSLSQAYAWLRKSQEQIADVEGEGSAQVYTEVADLYQAVDHLRARVSRIKPTGLFE